MGIGAGIGTALIPSVVETVSGVIRKVISSKDDQERLIHEVLKALILNQSKLSTQMAEIIKEEYRSKYWLPNNWRPLLMVTFTALICSRWFGYSAPGITDAEYMALWEIIKYGLCGYIGGRSVEKISTTVSDAIARIKK